MKSVSDLVTILSLKEIKRNTFEGNNYAIGSPNVFGGQVVAQALNAANRTVSDSRTLHSLHSYFLEPGNLQKPIIYKVEEIRNGGSFSTRRVTASQDNTIIFILAASFHKKQEGHEHQIALKEDIKQPEELLSWTDMLEKYGAFLSKEQKAFINVDRPIEFKPTVVPNPLEKKDLPPKLDVWFKVKGDCSNLSLQLKQQIISYISDYNILTACLNPHASKAHYGNTQMASLDHSMWFFRPFDLKDWILFSIESPNTFGARGLAKGNIFSRDGKLIASVIQEGLMRPIKK